MFSPNGLYMYIEIVGFISSSLWVESVVIIITCPSFSKTAFEPMVSSSFDAETISARLEIETFYLHERNEFGLGSARGDQGSQG